MTSSSESFGSVLVTGAMGCVGAWTVRELVRRGIKAVAFDLSTDRRRLEQVMSEAELGQVSFVAGDLTNLGSINSTIEAERVNRIIHLGALQLPFCRADPPGGAMVNVLGTVDIFEAARTHAIPHVIYTSSIVVFSMSGGSIPEGAYAIPNSHYGVYKLANEGSARAYWHDSGVASIGLRPLTVYGPGRDQGMTSSPTKAIVAAVLGHPYQIRSEARLSSTTPRRGLCPGRDRLRRRQGSRDIQPERLPGLDHGLCRGHRGSSRGRRGFDPARIESVAIPDDVDTTGLEALGPPPVTSLSEGIAQSVSRTAAFNRPVD